MIKTEREFKIGQKTFKFLFTHKAFYEDNNTLVMGFPYNMEVGAFDETKTESVKGYYTFVKFRDEYIEIITDIMANYRTYYMEKDDVVYFSNDFLTLFNMLPKEERKPNKFEFEYWDKHRYTTGGETLCSEIHKIKPASIYKFYENKIEEKLYFKDFENKPNREKHFEEVVADLRDTVSLIKKMPQKKFLLFSGGADSTLCVKLLQEQGVEFIPVFAKHVPTNAMNYDDILKVQYSAKLLGIDPVEIEIDTTKNIDDDVINIMFTDRSITQLFFITAEKLREKYGEDIILLNGQAADSIFSFGPTADGVRQNIIRNMLFRPFNPLNKIFYNLIFKLARPIYKNYRLTQNNHEYLSAFFDEKFYMPIIDKNKSQKYYENINNIISNLQNSIKKQLSLLMYLKAYGFMQGSDNFVNVQSCEFNGLKALFLYATPNIVYSTIRNTDYNYEVLHPKSVVYKILKDVFGYTMPNIKIKKNYKKEVKREKPFKIFENEVYQAFYDKVKSLEFSEEVAL